MYICLFAPVSESFGNTLGWKNPALIVAMGERSVTSTISGVGCGEEMGDLSLVFRLKSTKEGISTFFKAPEA